MADQAFDKKAGYLPNAFIPANFAYWLLRIYIFINHYIVSIIPSKTSKRLSNKFLSAKENWPSCFNNPATILPDFETL